ncbi:hypothetical protein GCM10027445_43510 [Amycolatopsis endophytica]
MVDVRVAELDGVVTVAVAGEVDLLTAPSLAEALADAAGLAPRAVEVDLSAVDFLSVAGAAALARAAEQLALRVRPVSHASRVTLVAAGLDHLLA